MKKIALGTFVVIGLSGCIAGSGNVELAGSSADRTDKYKATAGATTSERAIEKATQSAASYCAERGLTGEVLEASAVATVANAKHARVMFRCVPVYRENTDASARPLRQG